MMIKKLFDLLYKTEENYWWFIGQRYMVERYLKKYYNSKSNLKLLDIGCGTGATLNLLNKYGKPYGIDISENAIKYCKIRGFTNVKKSNVLDIKFGNNTFDVATCLGVFYHKSVKDDIKGLKEINRILKHGGRLIFFDCAMMSLFGKHTIAFHGIRRYSKLELELKLRKAGFEVEKISYINTILFPAVFVKRKLEKFGNAIPKSEVHEKINPLINSLLKTIFKFEIKGMDYVSYPFGVNIIAIAKKSSK